MNPSNITKDIRGPGTRYVDYQPGNGTAYRVLLTALTVDQCHQIGCQVGSAMVVVYRGAESSAYPLAVEGGLLHPNYVEEKFNCHPGDLQPVTELLGYLLNRPTP